MLTISKDFRSNSGVDEVHIKLQVPDTRGCYNLKKNISEDLIQKN